MAEDLRGPPIRRCEAMLGEDLLEIWVCYSKLGTSRHNRDDEDRGPFPDFLHTVFEAAKADFDGRKLARRLHEGFRGTHRGAR